MSGAPPDSDGTTVRDIAAMTRPPQSLVHTDQISVREALDPETLRRCARQATGQKFRVRPQR